MRRKQSNRTRSDIDIPIYPFLLPFVSPIHWRMSDPHNSCAQTELNPRICKIVPIIECSHSLRATAFLYACPVSLFLASSAIPSLSFSSVKLVLFFIFTWSASFHVQQPPQKGVRILIRCLGKRGPGLTTRIACLCPSSSRLTPRRATTAAATTKRRRQPS